MQVKIENSADKFRCDRDSFISERNTARRYTDMAQGRSFGTKRSLVSFRENDAHTQQGKFRWRYQRKSRKGCTRARSPSRRSTRPRLIVPPVSILHTSLSNAERAAHWRNNGKFQHTYERRRYAFLARDIYAVLLPP